MNDLAIVLSGGAARGAYQAGVLRFIFTELAPRVGRPLWPSIVSGTSVGALNGIAVACQDRGAVHLLSSLWQKMRMEDVVAPESASLLSAVRNLLAPKAGSALLDAAPLGALLRREVPIATLRQAIDSGRCRAFIVSTTELATGDNVLFLDTASADIDLQPLPGSRVEPARLSTEHLLASASIPIVFPPVTLGDHLYVDGGLRQNTPLRPVLKAGARRVMLISPHSDTTSTTPNPLDGVIPTLPFMAGKTLNALMSDSVDRDMQAAEQINRLISWGSQHYGPEFGARVERDLGMTHVSLLNLRPTEDLGRMASSVFHSAPPPTTKQLTWLLHTLADPPNTTEGESDLLAYFLFDRAFTGRAEALGFSDAQRQEEIIAEFLLATEPLNSP